MKEILILLGLCVFLTGCASNEVKQEDNSPQPSEMMQEYISEEYTELDESSGFDDTEYTEYIAKKEAAITLFSNETKLPIWTDISENIPYNSYTIEYQRELQGSSFVGCSEHFDIVEKNSKIFLKTDYFEMYNGVFFLEITEEQLQAILAEDKFNGLIYSFTITNIRDYDVEIFAEGEEDDNYISVYGVPTSIIIRATCNEIFRFI